MSEAKLNSVLDEMVKRQATYVESKDLANRLHRVGWMAAAPAALLVVCALAFQFVLAPPTGLDGRMALLFVLGCMAAATILGACLFGSMLLERAIARFAYKRMPRRAS